MFTVTDRLAKQVASPRFDASDGLFVLVKVPVGVAKFEDPTTALAHFVDRLAATGFSGQVDRFTQRTQGREQPDQMVCRIDLTGQPYVLLRVDGIMFELPDEDDDLVEQAVAWRDTTIPVTLMLETDEGYRWVDFGPDGGTATFAASNPASAGAGTPNAAWAGGLAQVRQVLLGLAPWTLYGRIRRLVQPPYADYRTDLLYHEWPTSADGVIPGSVLIRMITERGAVPDAFGVQLLPPHLAAKLPPLGSDWVRTDLDSGQVLIEHTDQTAWFSSALPDLPVLNAARTELANIIAPRVANR